MAINPYCPNRKLRGWFAFAPVWVQDPEGEVIIAPRSIFGQVLLPLAEVMVNSINLFLCIIDKDYEPHYSVHITDDF